MRDFKRLLAAGMAIVMTLLPAGPVIAAVSGNAVSAPEIPSAEAEYLAMVEEATSAANATVGGVRSEVRGFYYAKSVQGVSMAPSSGNDGSFYVKVMDTDKKKSTAAVAVADNVAAALGATVGPCINVTYGRMNNGSFTQSTDAANGALSVGVPKSFSQTGTNYGIIAVYPGGTYAIYRDTDNNPNTITVNIGQSPASNVMYALVKY